MGGSCHYCAFEPRNRPKRPDWRQDRTTGSAPPRRPTQAPPQGRPTQSPPPGQPTGHHHKAGPPSHHHRANPPGHDHRAGTAGQLHAVGFTLRTGETKRVTAALIRFRGPSWGFAGRHGVRWPCRTRAPHRALRTARRPANSTRTRASHFDPRPAPGPGLAKSARTHGPGGAAAAWADPATTVRSNPEIGRNDPTGGRIGPPDQRNPAGPPSHHHPVTTTRPPGHHHPAGHRAGRVSCTQSGSPSPTR